MNEDVFLIFGLGFFVFCAWIVLRSTRYDQDRLDRFDERVYNRQLNERREFGYEAVEKSNHQRPPIKYK